MLNLPMQVQFLAQFEEAIHEHLTDPNLSVSFLAAAIGISERALYRKVKHQTGQSPNQHILEFRLQKSKALLESGEYGTVKAVARAVGFANAHYFSQYFEKRSGRKPIKYL